MRSKMDESTSSFPLKNQRLLQRKEDLNVEKRKTVSGLHNFPFKAPMDRSVLSEKSDAFETKIRVKKKKRSSIRQLNISHSGEEKNAQVESMHLCNRKETEKDKNVQNKKIEVTCEDNIVEETHTIKRNKLFHSIEDDPFIYIDHSCIPKDVCKQIIARFLEDEHKYQGRIARGVDMSIKATWDLVITQREDWKEVDNNLCLLLRNALMNYSKRAHDYLATEYNLQEDVLKGYLQDTCDFGYQIQRYIKNEGFYNWHIDFTSNFKKDFNQVRLLTFIWYLNDVTEGGETEFLHGKVTPTAGKLLIFPSTITYFHKGKMPVSDDKYIITGWIGYKINGYV